MTGEQNMHDLLLLTVLFILLHHLNLGILCQLIKAILLNKIAERYYINVQTFTTCNNKLHNALAYRPMLCIMLVTLFPDVLDECRFLPDEFKQKAAATREHYYAIEIDPKLTIQEKTPYMVEWCVYTQTYIYIYMINFCCHIQCNGIIVENAVSHVSSTGASTEMEVLDAQRNKLL